MLYFKPCVILRNHIVEDVIEDKGPVNEREQEVASYDTTDTGQGTGWESHGGQLDKVGDFRGQDRGW